MGVFGVGEQLFFMGVCMVPRARVTVVGDVVVVDVLWLPLGVVAGGWCFSVGEMGLVGRLVVAIDCGVIYTKPVGGYRFCDWAGDFRVGELDGSLRLLGF